MHRGSFRLSSLARWEVEQQVWTPTADALMYYKQHLREVAPPEWFLSTNSSSGGVLEQVLQCICCHRHRRFRASIVNLCMKTPLFCSMRVARVCVQSAKWACGCCAAPTCSSRSRCRTSGRENTYLLVDLRSIPIAVLECLASEGAFLLFWVRAARADRARHRRRVHRAPLVRPGALRLRARHPQPLRGAPARSSPLSSRATGAAAARASALLRSSTFTSRATSW